MFFPNASALRARGLGLRVTAAQMPSEARYHGAELFSLHHRLTSSR